MDNSERGHINEPDSHIPVDEILEQARERGWEGDDMDWEDAVEHLRERNLQRFYPEKM